MAITQTTTKFTKKAAGLLPGSQTLNAFKDAPASDNMVSAIPSSTFVTQSLTATGELQTITSSLSPSVVTPATQRIGSITVERVTSTYTSIVEDSTLGGTKIGNITILGDLEDLGSISVDKFRQGAEVTTVAENCTSLLPHLTINSPESLNDSGFVVNLFERSSFGQLSSYNFNVFDDKGNFIPFTDFPGRVDAVKYVELGRYVAGYGILNNGEGTQTLNQFTDPDSSLLDGAIEIFEVRSKKVNTGISDIQITGIRASFGNASENMFTGKGGQIIDNKFEFNQSNYDFFEDSQDQVFTDSTFPQRGASGSNGYLYSLEGYVSEGSYGISPYKDIPFIDNTKYYKHLTVDQKNTLLTGSSRDMSEIGTRFKSAQNGFILYPNYDNTTSVVNSVLGTDSVAFRGLMRG